MKLITPHHQHSMGEVVQRSGYGEFGNIINDTNPGLQPFDFSCVPVQNYCRQSLINSKNFTT